MRIFSALNVVLTALVVGLAGCNSDARDSDTNPVNLFGASAEGTDAKVLKISDDLTINLPTNSHVTDPDLLPTLVAGSKTFGYSVENSLSATATHFIDQLPSEFAMGTLIDSDEIFNTIASSEELEIHFNALYDTADESTFVVVTVMDSD